MKIQKKTANIAFLSVVYDSDQVLEVDVLDVVRNLTKHVYILIEKSFTNRGKFAPKNSDFESNLQCH